MTKRKIGILGGSFNPAHEGHVYISHQAKSLLGLDEIWWLVSPTPPLRPSDEIWPFEERLAIAREITSDVAYIKVSDFELKFSTHHSVDTVVKLKEENPTACFVWIMGADNLVGLSKWHRWKEFTSSIPIAVFNREKYVKEFAGSEAYQYLTSFHIDEGEAESLAGSKPPAWCFF